MIEHLLHLDYQIFDFINQGCSNSLFDALMPIIRNKKTWFPLYIIAALVLLKIEKKRALWIIIFAILSVGLADLVSSHFLKNFFARTRPCLLQTFSDHINLVVERCSGAYSFPSSHAANHFALASFFLLRYKQIKPLGFVLILWASLISFAQIYVGVHFPTDILAGTLVGLLSGLTAYLSLSLILKKMA